MGMSRRLKKMGGRERMVYLTCPDVDFLFKLAIAFHITCSQNLIPPKQTQKQALYAYINKLYMYELGLPRRTVKPNGP